MMSRTFKQFLLFTVLLAGFALKRRFAVHAEADDQKDFISIDCGLSLPENSSHSESRTGINYVSDVTFVDTGENNLVHSDYKNIYQKTYESLRSFPQGIRNCYKINVMNGTKYLIRASFLYGNYDGQQTLPEFQLYLGPNLWDSLRLKDASTITNKELIHIPLRNYIHVCLVNTGSGVPFISALELRPLNNASYQTTGGSLEVVSRYDTGQTGNGSGYRFPIDIYDRFWYSYNDLDDWTQLNTSFTIDSEYHNRYQPPSVVMSNAATPKSQTDSLINFWPAEATDEDAEYYIYMHFAEVEKLQANQSRLQFITNNGELFYKSFAPNHLYTNTIFNKRALRGGRTNFSIIGADNSTLPPILNAFEIYIVKYFLQADTNQEDVDAITNIKSSYGIGKNWQGDPCAPQNCSWEGVICSYHDFEPPRIISLNLSSSGLTGKIVSSIFNLAVMQTLDLSDNNLTGQIPDFSSQLPNLSVLNLEENKLTGLVPVGLISRSKEGLLSLSLCGNPNLSGQVSCKKKKRNFFLPVIVSIGISILFLTVTAAFWWSFKRKRQHGDVTDAKATIQFGSMGWTKRKFTYSEIIKITNNFERTLGIGGFGTVYHGYIDKTQVAIKMLSTSSVQGLQQFNAEVDILMRVHHKNLTSLVGYCNDETKLGLVYEYMANGNLQEHLSDGRSNILTWEDRLRIATDAAQGLEYLHYGCKPPIMHRDVKSTNILLNEIFQAKLSDFGLSRNFPTNDGTRASSLLAGTPGYLDPEFYLSNRLNEKSDVHSFGIVLLEIITSRPAISRTQERINISQWVGFMLAKGDIYSIVDPRLEENFNVNSVWKAVEIAMACASTSAIKRPLMSQVVVDLKECLETELARTKQSHETGLTDCIEMMPDNSIINLTPSVR